MRRFLARIQGWIRSASRHGGSMLQVAGLGLVVAWAYLAAGLAWGLLAGGVSLILLSLALG